MRNKKIKKLVVLVITIIIIIGLGGLFAFLTDTDQKTNIFTLGSVKIELTETNWNPANAQNVLPGQPIPKNPTINNIGRNSAYVYIKVINPIVELTSGDGTLFNYTINSGWTQLDQKEQCGYKVTTYYYYSPLNTSSSTNALFDSVTINDYSDNVGEEQLLDIYAYGIQSTYLESGSTVQSIFTDAFTTSLSDTDEKCNSVIDCDNNESSTTAPSSLKGLAKIMAKNAYLDNGKSEYVNSCSGVDFSAISSDTNGKGIYEIASTKNDTYPIYYYRGAVDNNNVKFGGFCWKAIRSTNIGGVKMIYNGTPDSNGNCTNTTGTNTQIDTSSFNTSSHNLPTYVGYMYGSVYPNEILEGTYNVTDLRNKYFGENVNYSNGVYTLINTKLSIDNDHHYSCNKTTSTGTCSEVRYYPYGDVSNFNQLTGQDSFYYIILKDGEKVEDSIEKMFSNITDSTIKTQIDTWYNTNLSRYISYIEDTTYCNDRSISRLNGWDPNGGNIANNLQFNSFERLEKNHTPSLECIRTQDRFTVSNNNGNGDSTYPIGMITSDEVMYAGGRNSTSNNTYYLYTNQKYWTSSPVGSSFNYSSRMYTVSSNGSVDTSVVTSNNGLRPVISITPNAVISSGDGTSTNPYTVQTN